MARQTLPNAPIQPNGGVLFFAMSAILPCDELRRVCGGMSEQDVNPPAGEPVVVKQKMTFGGLAWRVGCLLIWLPLILLPILMFNLATSGEIVFLHGAGMPEPESHPWLRATLIMEIDTRGLNITRSSLVSTTTDGLSCVQTDVSFLLWAGKGDPVTYCDCYTKNGDAWALASTASGVCEG